MLRIFISIILISISFTFYPNKALAITMFKVGHTSYLLNDTAQNMDVAPYIKDGRTYMPIRFIAYALGLSDNNILWDNVSQKVTLIKGDKVVQLTIGSNILLVNGASITMDVAPEITIDRIMLPIRHVAKTFGTEIVWDSENQIIEIVTGQAPRTITPTIPKSTTYSPIIPSLPTLPSTPNVIESKIDGTFEGWEGDTIFKLTNGQIWQQDSFSYRYHYAYRPTVFIYKDSIGRYKMNVEGINDSIYVKRLK